MSRLATREGWGRIRGGGGGVEKRADRHSKIKGRDRYYERHRGGERERGEGGGREGVGRKEERQR